MPADKKNSVSGGRDKNTGKISISGTSRDRDDRGGSASYWHDFSFSGTEVYNGYPATFTVSVIYGTAAQCAAHAQGSNHGSWGNHRAGVDMVFTGMWWQGTKITRT
jgi:hypothetical protein